MKIFSFIITGIIVSATYSSDIDTLLDAADLMNSSDSLKNDTVHIMRDHIVAEIETKVDSSMIDSSESFELQNDDYQVHSTTNLETITEETRETKTPESNRSVFKNKRKSFTHLALGTFIGVSNSHIKSRGLLNYYFEPAERSNRTAPVFEIAMDIFLGDYVSLGTGLTYFNLGQKTEETSVFFNDNIFKHRLETFSELNYVGVPLLVKCGVKKSNFSIFVHGGGIPSYAYSSNIKWKVDGRDVDENTILPAVNINETGFVLVAGLETGYWFKNNGLLFVGRYLWGSESLASGIEGDAFNRGYMLGLKYSRKLF
ncbi:MAG: outer membrane beta-barrel protein [Chitinispirillaceae bacterium]|nr:outer membrane beta-barrel protein [Chitinispirillaceae bacterium]